ncbi:spermidine/putrescine ABC transporter permease [Companilactobacillus sp. RD055328]|uniref:ABC transporter permease n=1 Tax=Companilactobacillus sp. RD055328 TaxID=2916634 RepID=UPI001FC7CD6E|nr:ABC transporter permease [Companilactobacillus sp. RD055328]GKQ43003.1 spermidine/putrescine ABC transporter permease [Companilactobacillus sp. RD055328]
MKNKLVYLPYFFWMAMFVIIPIILIFVQSINVAPGQNIFHNYVTYFSSSVYLKMTLNSFIFAFIITFFCLLISYPAAYFIANSKYDSFLILLIILPTWINLLLKAYAFIGIFSHDGSVNSFLGLLGIAPKQLLFTNFSFIFVATYIEIPFMILPIYNSIKALDKTFIRASEDLGATKIQTFTKVILPLTMNGVRTGIQTVFIPSLSLFMLTRLIGGNRVITLGTAIEEHFLTTMNWGMGSTVGVILVIIMVLIIWITSKPRKRKVGVNIDE